MHGPPCPLPATCTLMRRFSFGYSPALRREVARSGGARAWFERQLGPETIDDPAGEVLASWFPLLAQSPLRALRAHQSGTMNRREYIWSAGRWTILRQARSRRQVHEVMTAFWLNHFHVFDGSDAAWPFRPGYDSAVRREALGRFDRLLPAAVLHPAMLRFLDADVSVRGDPNENLGRELLELHTVGHGGGYTEADVKASSRMLTGYRADVWWPEFRAFYDPSVHATGRIDVLDFSHPNTEPDGRAATDAYLRHLAHHPATARRIARRLAVRFVGDQPSGRLVTAVASAYLKSGTAIRPTLLALVDHPDFAAAAGTKVRLPTEDYVATVRALRVVPTRPVDDASFVNAMYWQYVGFGQAPYEWPAPDGYPEAGEAWTSAGRLLGGMRHHVDLAAGWWPNADVKRPSAAAWLPPLPATLGSVIDHVGIQLLGQRPRASVRRGIATLLGMPVKRQVGRGDLWDMRVYAIIASLLDSPTHLHR